VKAGGTISSVEAGKVGDVLAEYTSEAVHLAEGCRMVGGLTRDHAVFGDGLFLLIPKKLLCSLRCGYFVDTLLFST
jgi:hypothetical protein